MRLKVFACLLLFTSIAQASPWYRDKKVWAVIGSSIASSAVATKEAHDCRLRKDAGISFCNGGYGPFAAREVVRMAGALGTDALGLWGRHMGIKEWSALPLGYSGFNVYVAAQQAGIGCKAGTWPVWGTKYDCQPWTWGTNEAKPDLSHIAFVRH